MHPVQAYATSRPSLFIAQCEISMALCSFTIDGPTFAKFWFQNTKPICTLPPSLLKWCIENKANCRQSRAEINEIYLQEEDFITLMIIIFLCILIFFSCFSHHNLFYNVWQERYINLIFALLCLQLAVFSIQKIRFSSSSLFVDVKAGLPIAASYRITNQLCWRTRVGH